jgi:hypothetical protein
MKAQSLFLLVFGTSITTVLFLSGSPELAAIGILTGFMCIYGWAEFIGKTSKW